MRPRVASANSSRNMTADQGGEDVDGGGLAGAIAAEEAEDGALLDRQADPADRR